MSLLLVKSVYANQVFSACNIIALMARLVLIIIGRAAESIACYSTLAFYGTEYYIYQYFLTFTNIQDTLYIYIYICIYTYIILLQQTTTKHCKSKGHYRIP